MTKGIGTLSWVNIKSAMVYAFIALALYILSIGDLFILDWRACVNAFVLGLLTSLVKNILTTKEGNFAGVVKVIPDTK